MRSMEFEMVGTLLGLAIFNNHILALSLPLLVYQCAPSPTGSVNPQPAAAGSLRHGPQPVRL